MKKITIFAATIVAPTGVEKRIEISIPVTEQQTEITADTITTPLKLCINLIADNAGKMINAEINNDPTNFIPNTIIVAITTAIIKLCLFVFIPVAFAKFSSKVTAKIR